MLCVYVFIPTSVVRSARKVKLANLAPLLESGVFPTEFNSRSRELARDSGQRKLTSSQPNLKRILACLCMRSNAPVEHCGAERLSQLEIETHH